MNDTDYQIGVILQSVSNLADVLNQDTLKGRITDSNVKELKQYTKLFSYMYPLGSALMQTFDSDKRNLASEAAADIHTSILVWEFTSTEPYKNSSGENITEEICVASIKEACEYLMG